MKRLLDLYTRGIGQLINWEKSLLFFINTHVDRQRKITSILRCGVRNLPLSYLGLPLGTKLPDSFWNGIIDMFSKKLVGWKGTTLNQARECVLVK